IDGSLYLTNPGSAIGVVDTMPFLSISYDTSDKISIGGYNYYRRRGALADFISSYSFESVSINGDPGYYTRVGGFAGRFAAHVLEGQPFRELAATAPVLAQKYSWLKQNVFAGVEFATGNPRYAQFFSQSDRPGNEIDFSRRDPSFVWDYQLPRLEAVPLDYFAVVPCRLLDTRQTGLQGGPALAGGTVRDFLVTGICGIPLTAKALAINATVTQASSPGSISLFASSEAEPPGATIYYGAGKTRANNAIVAPNGSGTLTVKCNQASGDVHFILDVNGYFE